MKRCCLPLIILLVLRCAVAAGNIPLSKVLARPRDFDGKRIAVTGYYFASTETSCLFTTREAARRSDRSLSAWVEFRNPRAAPDYIAVPKARLVGVFHYQPRPILDGNVPYERRFRGFGCYKMYAFEIADVSSFHALSQVMHLTNR
jgi:hypothetical protein